VCPADHLSFLFSAGVGEIPHLAGIGSGKLISARYNELLLVPSDMGSITKAMVCRTARLESLHLSSCNLGLEHIKTLCLSLVRIAASTGGTLTALDLSHNEGVGFMGAQHIAAMLKMQRTNFHLDLTNCTLVGVGSGAQQASKDWQQYCADGVTDLAAAVECRTFFTQLSLRKNHICHGARPAALKALCSAIRYGQLRSVDLSQNDLDNDMVNMLAGAVEHSLTLEEMDIRSNNFDSGGANSLLKVIDAAASAAAAAASAAAGTGTGEGGPMVQVLCGIPLSEDAVTELELSADSAEGRTLQVGGALLLSHYLRQPQFQQLQKLDLTANLICYRGSTSGCIPLCAAIGLLPITALNMSANDIAVGGVSDGVAAVMKMVQHMASKAQAFSAARKSSRKQSDRASSPANATNCWVDMSLNSLNKSQAESLASVCAEHEVKLVLSDDPRGSNLDAATTFDASSSADGKVAFNPFKKFERSLSQSKMMAKEGDGGWLLKRSDRVKGLHKWDKRQFVRRGRLLHFYVDAQ
jgi:hypothetical protein